MIQRRRIEQGKGIYNYRPSFLNIFFSLVCAVLLFGAGFFFGGYFNQSHGKNYFINEKTLDSLQLQLLTHQSEISSLQNSLHSLESELQKIKSAIQKNQQIPESTNSDKNSAKTDKKESFLISLQILNGCGVEGITQKMADFLKSYDVKITGTGNYKSFKVKNSFFISQKKIPTELKELAKFLGISSRKIYQKKVRSKSDYILILGKDYKSLKPFKK